MIAPIAPIASRRVVISVDRKREKGKKKGRMKRRRKMKRHVCIYLINEKRSEMREKKKNKRKSRRGKAYRNLVNDNLAWPVLDYDLSFECYN